jgi:parallel beta-helix repeat protein
MKGNAISNSGDGIVITTSEGIRLVDNTVSNISRSRWISDHNNQSKISERMLFNKNFLGFSHNTGLMVIESDDVRLLNNSVSYSEECGISLVEAENCTVSGGLTVDNSLGISLKRSNNNTLVGNRTFRNQYGLKLSKSRGNIIYFNALIGNLIAGAFDEEGSNFWDNGTKGNYYGQLHRYRWGWSMRISLSDFQEDRVWTDILSWKLR